MSVTVQPFAKSGDPKAPRCRPVVMWIDHPFVPEGRSSVGPGQAWARCIHCGSSLGQATELPRIAGRDGGRPTDDEAKAIAARWRPVACPRGWRARLRRLVERLRVAAVKRKARR